MPCAGTARGHRTSFTPMPGFTLPAALTMPFYDPTNNDPCGKFIVTNANGVAFADNLCLFHLGQKYGLAAVQAPYTFAA